MLFIVPLTLASAVLGLPHLIRNPSNGIMGRNAGACANLPFGALPDVGCDASSSGAPSSAPSPAVSRRRRTKKREDTSTCQLVSSEDYIRSPFKDTLEQTAKTNWGGDFEVVINPADYPDSPLHFCYTPDAVPPAFDYSPTCKSATAQVSGTVAEGATDIALQITQGASATHSIEVREATSITASTAFTVNIGLPGIEGESSTSTVSITGAFERGETHATTDNNQVATTVTAHATKPGPCNINLNVTTCTGETTVVVPAFYTGYVWYDYNTRRGSADDKHYKWSLNVDALVPANLRSDNMTLKDSITAVNYGHFDTACS